MDMDDPNQTHRLGAFHDGKEYSVTTNSFPRDPDGSADGRASGARFFRPQPAVSLTVKKGNQVIGQKRKSIISKLGQTRNIEDMSRLDHEPFGSNAGAHRDQNRGGSQLFPSLGSGMRQTINHAG